MQGHSGTNLLRNSYGFNKQPPSLRNSNAKGFPMPHTYQPAESLSTNIQQQKNKLEGVEGKIKKKFSQEVPLAGSLRSRLDGGDSRVKNTFIQPEQPLTQSQLRGSCQEILRKFDYSNLRNTAKFEEAPRQIHKQIRRSPQQQQSIRMHVNKTYTQEYKTPSFIKDHQKKEHNNHTFCIQNVKTPPETPPQGYTTGRSPARYKTMPINPKKKSGIVKSEHNQDNTTYQTLAQLTQNKQKKLKHSRAKSYERSKMINGFQLGKALGKGKFGEVFLSRHHSTGFIAAIKKIQKKKVVEYKMVDQFVKQIRLHASLDHPNIVKFFGVFQEKEHIYLVMEYMNGGTLFDQLNQVPNLPVKTAAEYLKDIIEAVTYMHDRSIAHRDIKPENIVISTQGVAKLCDFGWSAIVETSRKTYCGTFDYAPPEILERKNYDTSVDIWCIGVLTYELLTGRVPFEGQQRKQIMQKILNVDKNRIDYPVELPDEAKEFIEALVQKNPAERPKCHELLKFRLFSNFLPKGGKPKKLQ